MTQLLVSVRDATEARVAMEAGVDLIDVKEPRLGSLGKADDRVIEQVARVVSGRRPISVALGELTELDVDAWRWQLPPTIAFAKVGLAHCAGDKHWPRRLAALWERFPSAVGRVGVIYADWQAAGAPAPDEILRHAAQLGAAALLVDTFDKSQPRLTQLWSPRDLDRFFEFARQHALTTVLAGRLSADDFPRLLPYAPGFIAVRGAGCAGDRSGCLEARRIVALKQALSGES